MSDQKKVGIVTAASRGIGAACARKLSREGYKLVIMSRSDEIFPMADELDARPIQGSVEISDDLDRLVKFTFEKYGRLDAVVLNTGHPAKGDLLEISDEEWRSGMDLILLSVIRMCRLVMPIMLKNKGGSVVNISAFGSREPSLKFPVSSVMRSALSGYTKLFATQFASNNIRINNILPGMISTYPIDEETLERIPMKRQGKPEEIAELAYFLLSDQSSYITGQSFLIDGGMVKSL